MSPPTLRSPTNAEDGSLEMTIEQTTDWTTPEAYFVRPPSRLALAAALMTRLWLEHRAGAERRQQRRTEQRYERQLRRAFSHLPAYLRRDIGVPPYS